MSPKVSVIIPAYNSAVYLPEAIDSVLAQSFKDYEIIVINNGSTDQTDEVVRKYEGKIRYQFLPENLKAAGARNKGMEMAQGRYIAFLDADDVWHSDRLERSIRFLEEHPETGLIHGKVEVIDEHGKLNPIETGKIQKYYEKEKRKGSGYFRLLDSCAMLTSTVTFRKECLGSVGFYDQSLPTYEDYDWYLRFALNYSIGLPDGKPDVCYRMYPGNYTKKFNQNTTAEIYLNILEKQLQLIGGKFSGAEYRNVRARILSKMAEFYWVRREKEKVKQVISESIQLNPGTIFDIQSMKRLILSL